MRRVGPVRGFGCVSELESAKVASEASKPQIQRETPQISVEAGGITSQLGDAQGPLDVMTGEVVVEREVVLAQASQVEVLDPQGQFPGLPDHERQAYGMGICILGKYSTDIVRQRGKSRGSYVRSIESQAPGA